MSTKMEPPSKRQRKGLLEDSSSDSDQSEQETGPEFKVNKEYARRFEYNKKREEIQQLEVKLGKSAPNKKGQYEAGAGKSDESEESSSEEEDDDGALATEAVDSEIFATLAAIRSKDPKVYDPKTTFFSEFDADATNEPDKEEKPMYLRDYHRQNLLKGGPGDDEDAEAPKTFAQEQADLKRSVIKEMHAAADDEGAMDVDDAGSDEDDGFLVAKEKSATSAKPKKAVTEADIAVADKDPETYLSNFINARAWIPTKRANFEPFESDDEDEEKKAEVFEEAYNFRFEDPNKLNEALVSHARDTTSKYSVRREELSGRKKQREAERQKKEEQRNQREVERARLRKLKIEQVEEKVVKIKQAAGINSSDISAEDWARFLEEGWDDDRWEAEMKKRFGNKYYAAQEEEAGDSDGSGTQSSKKRRLKKPKWDDDIDIKDIVPDFVEDDEEEGGLEQEEGDDDDAEPSRKFSKKDMLRDKRDKQREARKERRKIEEVVDKDLDMEIGLLPGATKKYSGTFRYRETSPLTFGLTSRDILMADDTQLNKYAGLKKLAPFRDSEKKKRDNKRLAKKARLREWRKETFGNEDGPPVAVPAPEAKQNTKDTTGDAEMNVDIREGSKKRRKRSKKH